MKRGYTYRNMGKMESRHTRGAAAIHHREKKTMIIAGFILILLLVLLGNSIRVFASSGKQAAYHKYYTSVQLEKGDSLWSLADEYNGEYSDVDSYASYTDYIDEVCRINQITEDTILHSGNSVVVPYYALEIK